MTGHTIYIVTCPIALTQVLRSAGHTLCGVLETHFHADFVSGHCEVGRRVGVPVYFGPSAKERSKFPVHELQDNEVLLLLLLLLLL